MKFFIGMLLFFGIISLYAQENLTPKQIIDKSLEHKTISYDNAKAEFTMILINSDKEKEIRKVKIKSKKVNGLTKTLAIFQGGKEINGVKFLTLEIQKGKYEQYIYYPAQNKINRIVSQSNKNEYFLGTDFTYSDLEGNYGKNSKYRKLKDDKIGKNEVYVIESIPEKESIYSKVILYIRKSDFIPLKIKFYDKDNKYFKQYSVKKIKTIDSRKVVSLSKVLNKKNKHATILKLDNIKFDVDINDTEFNKENLR